MKRTILLYGLVAGLLAAALRAIEYRTLVVDHAIELYGGLVAALFAALGVWLGRRVVRPRVEVRLETRVETREVVVERVREVVREAGPPTRPAPARPTPNGRDPGQLASALARFGVTRREHEILTLIAEGLSTREIAARLEVTDHTVKSHTGRLYDKLGARRRTQAVQTARAAGLLP